jgi:hypothetical protein
MQYAKMQKSAYACVEYNITYAMQSAEILCSTPFEFELGFMTVVVLSAAHPLKNGIIPAVAT